MGKETDSPKAISADLSLQSGGRGKSLQQKDQALLSGKAEVAISALFQSSQGEGITWTPLKYRILAILISYSKQFSGASSNLLQQEEGNFQHLIADI